LRPGLRPKQAFDDMSGRIAPTPCGPSSPKRFVLLSFLWSFTASHDVVSPSWSLAQLAGLDAIDNKSDAGKRVSVRLSLADGGAGGKRKEMLMTDTINTGTILIKASTPLPEGLQLESEPYAKGWRLVKNLRSSGMDRQLFEADWTFFYMAEEIEVSVVGSDLEKTTRRAVKRAIASLKSEKLNCLEITQVAVKHFLGVPYLTVSAQPRHIQESMFLFHTKPVPEWHRAKLAAA
jgi:hypothetical protein